MRFHVPGAFQPADAGGGAVMLASSIAAGLAGAKRVFRRPLRCGAWLLGDCSPSLEYPGMLMCS